MNNNKGTIALLLSGCVVLTLTLPHLFVNESHAKDSYPVDTLNMSGQQSEYDCLVEAIYYEAGNQPFVGKVAVAQVVVNRVNSRHHPDTVCDVVHEGPISQWWWDNHRKVVPIKHKCQFSWWCDGKPDTIHDWKTYNKIKKLMLTFTTNRSIIDITEGATHYHADYVFPDWAATKLKTIEIEDHKFYRWE